MDTSKWTPNAGDAKHGEEPVKDEDRSYYGSSIDGLEAWDVIEAFDFGYNLGNVFKYISRAGKKPGNKREADLKKALVYLRREYENVKVTGG